MERGGTRADVSVLALLASVSSLKNGGFSVVCHVPFAEIEHVGKFHEMHDHEVRLEITDMGELDS